MRIITKAVPKKNLIEGIANKQMENELVFLYAQHHLLTTYP